MCVTLETMVGTPNGGNFRFPMCLNPSKADHWFPTLKRANCSMLEKAACTQPWNVLTVIRRPAWLPGDSMWLL